MEPSVLSEEAKVKGYYTASFVGTLCMKYLIFIFLTSVVDMFYLVDVFITD